MSHLKSGRVVAQVLLRRTFVKHLWIEKYENVNDNILNSSHVADMNGLQFPKNIKNICQLVLKKEFNLAVSEATWWETYFH